jgi:prephenate dehydrogenase
VAILGAGVLGGSIALSLKRLFPDLEVTVWVRREEAIAEVRSYGIAASTHLPTCLLTAGIVILCVPVGSMKSLLEDCLNAGLMSGAIVTDVGSVKAKVVRDLEPLAAAHGHVFVGSHPMAGSEKNGMSAASATLFQGASCAVTPGESTPPHALALVIHLWETLGCRVLQLDAVQHDHMVARISHLPHLLSAVLVQAALDNEWNASSLAGGGFRDMSRIAAGPPVMWEEIFRENKEALLDALDDWQHKLDQIRTKLQQDDRADVLDFLWKSKHLREVTYPPHS